MSERADEEARVVEVILRTHKADLMPARENRYAECDCGWESESDAIPERCLAQHREHLAALILEALR